MGKYIFSANNTNYTPPLINAFYDTEYKESYVEAGTWPSNYIEVSDEIYSTYNQSAPDGKTLGSDKNGNPVWVDREGFVPITEEDLANQKKQTLLNYATQKIAPLQDAVDLDIATEDEKAQLVAWKKYRVLVNRVDTSTAPSITWPTSPDDESTTSTATDTTTGDATTS